MPPARTLAELMREVGIQPSAHSLYTDSIRRPIPRRDAYVPPPPERPQTRQEQQRSYNEMTQRGAIQRDLGRAEAYDPGVDPNTGLSQLEEGLLFNLEITGAPSAVRSYDAFSRGDFGAGLGHGALGALAVLGNSSVGGATRQAQRVPARGALTMPERAPLPQRPSGNTMMQWARELMNETDSARALAAVASMEEWALAQRAQGATMRNVTPRLPDGGASGAGNIEVRSTTPGFYHAYIDGRRVGSLDINTRGNETYVANVLVEPEFRRQGVATRLYEAVERDIGRPLSPNPVQTQEGQAFWRSRRATNAPTAGSSGALKTQQKNQAPHLRGFFMPRRM